MCIGLGIGLTLACGGSGALGLGKGEDEVVPDITSFTATPNPTSPDAATKLTAVF